KLKLTAFRSTVRAVQFTLHVLGMAVLVLVVVYVAIRVLLTSTVQALSDLQPENPLSLQKLRSPRLWPASARAVVAVLIALLATLLWSFSLQWVDVGGMNDLGLVSVLPVPCIIALGILTLGFCVVIRSLAGVYPAVPLLYLLALIFVLYATPALVEQAPRFSVTYWLAGHTEYILRTGTVNPFLDAYFNWPGFFVLTALLTDIAGVHSVLVFAPWASFAYNLLYIAPIYLIFTTATADRRTVWLGLWFFYITDWVWQDYFDPQGLNLFFYLVIIAILLKGFKAARATPNDRLAALCSLSLRSVRHMTGIRRAPTWFRAAWAQSRTFRVAQIWPQVRSALPWAWSCSRIMWARMKTIRPRQLCRHVRSGFLVYWSRFQLWAALSDTPGTPPELRRRVALLGTLIAVFALSVFSHPITPFFVLLSVTALTLFGRITPRWLPILLAVMVLGWDFTVATPYMAGHLRADLASFGNIAVVASTNVTNRLVAGSPEHQLVSHLRVLTTVGIWGLAILGALLRWRGNLLTTDGAGLGKDSQFSLDVPFLLLVVAPGILVVAQPYGGEMAMRYYLFTLPVVSFFAAAAFRTSLSFHMRAAIHAEPLVRFSRWLATRSASATSLAIVASCLLLLGGFMFARYGNERADYITFSEASAVAYLYQVAPPHSLLLEGWNGTPWRYEDLELYDYAQLYTGQNEAAALQEHHIQSILDLASNTRYPAVYVIFSRSQTAQAQMYGAVSPTAFDVLKDTLLASGRFELIYQNPDAEILLYVHPYPSGGFWSRPTQPYHLPQRKA
ncbi:MAG: hypothetical protein C5B60_01030, partial [Chloroflexi bacterium]